MSSDLDHFAEDGALVGTRKDRFKSRVFGVEFDPAPLETQPFHGSFVSNESDNDLPRLSGRLRAHDHDVSRENTRSRHAFPVDAEGEELAAARRLGGLVRSTESSALGGGAGGLW